MFSTCRFRAEKVVEMFIPTVADTISRKIYGSTKFRFHFEPTAVIKPSINNTQKYYTNK